MVKHGLLGFATRRAASPAASTCDSTRRAWSRKVRPRASTQSHERDASAVALLPLPQDHGSAGSAMAATCAAFAQRPPSCFRLPQSQQNIEDVVAPFRLPCPQGIGASLTKYVANGALPHPTRQSISAARGLSLTLSIFPRYSSRPKSPQWPKTCLSKRIPRFRLPGDDRRGKSLLLLGPVVGVAPCHCLRMEWCAIDKDLELA